MNLKAWALVKTAALIFTLDLHNLTVTPQKCLLNEATSTCLCLSCHYPPLPCTCSTCRLLPEDLRYYPIRSQVTTCVMRRNEWWSLRLGTKYKQYSAAAINISYFYNMLYVTELLFVTCNDQSLLFQLDTYEVMMWLGVIKRKPVYI